MVRFGRANLGIQFERACRLLTAESTDTANVPVRNTVKTSSWLRGSQNQSMVQYTLAAPRKGIVHDLSRIQN
jgi:hypothetical protein